MLLLFSSPIVIAVFILQVFAVTSADVALTVADDVDSDITFKPIELDDVDYQSMIVFLLTSRVMVKVVFLIRCSPSFLLQVGMV